jgi:hypothetical protein
VSQMNLYLGVVVTLMFLSGCFLIVVSIRQRSEERRRWRGSNDGRSRPHAETKPL